ncbi:MAG: hypothetical protein E6230_15930 [Paenibacillus dendritiformis]|uniref:hypothetical protein n=1 Tax=uncultured Paenibacillus sp. TaxID=227322 RepID=UPI0025F31F26|nr:hypothetical protein [uncultured Paenibacillus sp.]MDU5143667.1 hypothetical protein [Paenibacillus dendritiformis]
MNQVDNEDAEYLEKVLITQSSQLHKYPLSEIDHKKIKSLMVRTHDNKHISVSVPIKEEDEIDESKGKAPIRESSIIQAKIAQLGERMGFKVWIPKSDRTKVLENWLPDNENNLLNQLPLNYDETTLFTIEQIDVLWIRNRSIIRAFEVEHTTSIYSGILRMADLMALQPNLDIKAHIVAPIERREKVLPRNK